MESNEVIPDEILNRLLEAQRITQVAGEAKQYFAVIMRIYIFLRDSIP